MNAQVLQMESPHVREEWEKLRFLNACQSRGMTVLIAALLDAGVDRERLPGTPPASDEPLEWLDYLVSVGAAELVKAG